MANENTLPRIWWPLMLSPSVTLDHCAICGRAAPLNQHHMVRRSAGELCFDGKPAPKPTITLCGFGNNLRDADGRFYCHGLAHHGMLHFRWSQRWTDDGFGCLEYLRTDEPTNYDAVLEMDGWRRVRTR